MLLESFVDEKNRIRSKFFLRMELSELEEFAKSHSPSEPFPATDSLKDALREWALALTNRRRADTLVQEFKQKLMNVMSGNVFVEQAEKSIRRTPSFSSGWLLVDEDRARIDEWYSQRAENWQAGRWHDHSESLKGYLKLEDDSQGERSG